MSYQNILLIDDVTNDREIFVNTLERTGGTGFYYLT